ncbi:MAG: ribosome maturation factor RimP [Clostridia bacterium]|nr:ribosome maturation factor RimP [Clostridia bacterium]
MAKIADTVYSLIEDTVLSLGVTLWDVRFVKEGASYYLRIYIDKESGVTIDDCVAVSHAIDPIIDEADPIDKQYYLEVCSPGVERELTRDWHYTASAGKRVTVKFFSAVSGKKEFSGTLEADKDGLYLITDEGRMPLDRSKIAKAYIEYQD